MCKYGTGKGRSLLEGYIPADHRTTWFIPYESVTFLDMGTDPVGGETTA